MVVWRKGVRVVVSCPFRALLLPFCIIIFLYFVPHIRPIVLPVPILFVYTYSTLNL